jgi:hypothetical protein
VDVSVGTFNLNNLFGRWNLYADVPAPPPTGAPAPAITAFGDRTRLRLARRGAGRQRGNSAIATTVARRQDRDRVPADRGRDQVADEPLRRPRRLKKKLEATAKLAERIKALDVLAVQEVESIEALDEFATRRNCARPATGISFWSRATTIA